MSGVCVCVRMRIRIHAHMHICINYDEFRCSVRIILGSYRYRLSCSLGWKLVKEYSVDF
jgi:hypothetical protein